MPIKDQRQFHEETVKALLLELQRQGQEKVTRTMLIKLLYLLDVFAAEDSNGQTWTGFEWRFIHFGPYDGAAQAVIDGLVGHGIHAVQRTGESGKEYILYSLMEFGAKAMSLAELAIPIHVRNRIRQIIGKYGNSLPKLLEFVYFRTAPMQEARPGETLSFDKCEKLTIDDFRHRSVAVSTERKERAKALLKQLSNDRTAMQERLSRLYADQGPFDDIYHSAMRQFEDNELPLGLEGIAYASFPRD